MLNTADLTFRLMWEPKIIKIIPYYFLLVASTFKSFLRNKFIYKYL